jgi:hypothetical protein
VTRRAGDPGRDPKPAIRIRPYLQAPPPLGSSEADASSGAGGTDALAPGPPQGLRPFVLTSGRVESIDPAIGLETQVTARIDGAPRTGTPLPRLAPELRDIVVLCAEPTSVAEISARLRLHLGVTKILVGDLRVTGHLDVHTSDTEYAHDPNIILRVIDGLRAIS